VRGAKRKIGKPLNGVGIETDSNATAAWLSNRLHDQSLLDLRRRLAFDNHPAKLCVARIEQSDAPHASG
jgi:hypothetical protein